MSRRSILLAATSLCLACPAGTGKPTGPAPSDDAALRIRIAQAEARRAGGVDELAELAAHGAKHQRLLALRGLGRIGVTGGARTIAILAGALGDPDPAVIGAAAGAIGVAASLDEDAFAAAGVSIYELTNALIAALPRGGGPVVEALGRAGTAAAQPALVAALAGLSDPALAELAGLALARHGRRKIELAEPARGALVAATASADPKVRYAAVYALAREHQPPDHPAAVAALVVRLGDPVAEIRAQAIAGLGRRKAVASARTAAGSRLEELLLDRDWRVAVEAVRALGSSDGGGGDAGKDAIAAAIVRRYGELVRGDAAAAQVILEGEKVLAGAFQRPLVAAALATLAAEAPAATALPALTRGWIVCLAVAATERGKPEPDLSAVERCALDDQLRLPLEAELISEGVGSLAARRAALGRLLAHSDPRVRAAGLGALAALWKAGDDGDHRAAITTLIAVVASPDPVVAGAAVEAATAIYEVVGTGDRSALAALDTAVIVRAATERDPELGSAILTLLGKHIVASPASPEAPAGVEACRAALGGDPVRAKAAAGCLKSLGETSKLPPFTADPPPVDVSTVIGKVLRWRVTTTRGDLMIRLHPDVAPWAVATIVTLTRKGFYNGLAFHRVVPNFVVQGGDPTESGAGGPGFSIPAEPGTLTDGAGYQAGGVGIADAGHDSGGSQWFVMHSRAPYLDGRYTWIGTLESGQKPADALLIGDRIVSAAIEGSP